MQEPVKKWKQPKDKKEETQSTIEEAPTKPQEPEVFGKPASSFKEVNQPQVKQEKEGEKEKPETPPEVEKKESKRDKMLREAQEQSKQEKDPETLKAEAESKALMVKAEAEAQAVRVRSENEFLMSTPEGRKLLFDERIMKQRLALAEKFFLAGCFTSDVRNAQQAFVKIQAGAEMGMEPMRAMNGLYMVNGKVTVWGQETSRRLKEHGWELFYENETDEGVTVRITKKGKAYKESVKKDEPQLKNSKAMGFAPKNKMRFYGLAQLVKFHVPEVLNGHEITENIIDMPPIEVQAEEANIDQVKARKEELRNKKKEGAIDVEAHNESQNE